MSAQNTYNFSTPRGHAGGLYDLSTYAVDAFINEADTGALKFGMGVVRGTAAGSQVKLPVNGSTVDKFEGVVTNDRTTEYDMEGGLHVRKGAAVGVMRYGRIWARVAPEIQPKYGDPVWLICDGVNAGCFQNVDGSSSPKTVQVKGRFLGGVDANAQVAAIELFNQAQA